MTVIVIDYPGLPVPKHRPRFTKSGKVYSSGRSANFENSLGMIARAAMGGRKPFACPVAVRIAIRFAFPEGWNRAERLFNTPIKNGFGDLDNHIKACLDAINKIVFEDDRLVCEIVARKEFAGSDGILIQVTPLQSEVVPLFRRAEPLKLIGEVA